MLAHVLHACETFRTKERDPIHSRSLIISRQIAQFSSNWNASIGYLFIWMFNGMQMICTRSQKIHVALDQHLFRWTDKNNHSKRSLNFHLNIAMSNRWLGFHRYFTVCAVVVRIYLFLSSCFLFFFLLLLCLVCTLLIDWQNDVRWAKKSFRLHLNVCWQIIIGRQCCQSFRAVQWADRTVFETHWKIPLYHRFLWICAKLLPLDGIHCACFACASFWTLCDWIRFYFNISWLFTLCCL